MSAATLQLRSREAAKEVGGSLISLRDQLIQDHKDQVAELEALNPEVAVTRSMLEAVPTALSDDSEYFAALYSTTMGVKKEKKIEAKGPKEWFNGYSDRRRRQREGNEHTCKQKLYLILRGAYYESPRGLRDVLYL